MKIKKSKRFADKHGPDIKPDSSIKAAILKHTENAKLPCDVAFEIAKDLGISTDLVGINADLLNIKLIKCQMGLFGYRPRKNIVKPQTRVNPDLKDAVLDASIDGKLPCITTWEIASRLNISKLAVSGACEALNIKIKPCQLGAF